MTTDDLNPALIEKAARAAFNAAPAADGYTQWDNLRNWQQALWRTIAYAAISAVTEDLWDEPATASQGTGRSLADSLLQAAWEAAETPESGVIEPGQHFIARSGGGNYYTTEAVTRMSCRGLVHELRLL